jgi:hypothetical protein
VPPHQEMGTEPDLVIVQLLFPFMSRSL